VPLGDYRKNIVEIIALARARKAGAVLLYNELWMESPYRRELRSIAETEKAPFVDASTLVAEAKQRIERDLERKLGLEPTAPPPPSKSGNVEVIFRVYAGTHPVPGRMYVAGHHAALGDLVPNRIAMYDDGTHGDQQPGDRVWSRSVTLPRRADLFYVYTNSGKEGEWEGLDLPALRKLEIQGNRASFYTPIDSFGRLYMQADNWHTNAEGYELIANELFQVLKRERKVGDYVRASATTAVRQ
jgi:lysophospholipase L1-like esterase